MTTVRGSESDEICEKLYVGDNGAAVILNPMAIEILISAALGGGDLNENQTSILTGLLGELEAKRALPIGGLLTLYEASTGKGWAKEQLFYALLGGAAVDLFIWLSTKHQGCPVLGWLKSGFQIPEICGHNAEETLPNPEKLKDILSTALDCRALCRAYEEVSRLLALGNTEEESERVRNFLHFLNLICRREHGKLAGP